MNQICINCGDDFIASGLVLEVWCPACQDWENRFTKWSDKVEIIKSRETNDVIYFREAVMKNEDSKD